MAKQFISSAAVSSPSEPRLMAPGKLSSLLTKISEWLMVIAVGAAIIFFFPFTSQILEFPKQLVLLVLVSLALLSWLGASLVDRVLVLRRSIANIAVLIFLAVVAISAVFSSARYVSLIGDYGREYASLISVLLFVFSFFIIVNLPKKRELAGKFNLVFIAAVGLSSLIAIFMYAGVNLFPFISSNTFNSVGSTVVLALAAAAAIVCSSVYLLKGIGGKGAMAKKIIVGISVVASTIITVLVDFWPVWTALIIGLLIVLVYALVRPQAFRRITWLAVPMGVLVISVLLLFINLPLPIRAPIEIFPSTSQSLGILGGALKKSPVIGTGPGTFINDFSRFRGNTLNSSQLWYLRFDRADSLLITVGAELGLAGMVALLMIIVIALWKSAAFLIFGKGNDDENWFSVLGLSVTFIALTAGALLYGSSLATTFMFWVFFALLVRAFSADTVTVQFKSSPRTALTATFLFVVFIIASVAGWFFLGTKLYADVLMVRASSRAIPKEINAVVADLEKAANANPRSDLIMRNLSAAYLIAIQSFAADQSSDATKAAQTIKSLTLSSVNAAKLATTLSPNDVANWSMLGSVYENISSFVIDAPPNALIAYGKASELEPASPLHHLALGRIHLIFADNAANEAAAEKDASVKAEFEKTKTSELAAAEGEFNKALELKTDYAEASYELATVYERQEKTDEAIKKLAELAQANPGDSGLAFELGILYFRAGKNDEATRAFSSAIAINPKFANARWYLSLVLEAGKNYQGALDQLKILLADNKDNETVKQQIDKVTSEMNGKAATTENGSAAPLPENR